MNKQELYIHIGTVKTGTSAIQRFLDANRNALQKRGIVYPINKDHFAHHRLSWSLRTKIRPKLWNWPEDLGTPEEEWEYVLGQLTGSCGLISSEDLFWCPPGLVAETKKLTSKFNVKLIVYWRRRDLLADSWYNELVKTGGLVTLPSYRKKLTSKSDFDE